jgi:hypothetical protein
MKGEKYLAIPPGAVVPGMHGLNSRIYIRSQDGK